MAAQVDTESVAPLGNPLPAMSERAPELRKGEDCIVLLAPQVEPEVLPAEPLPRESHHANGERIRKALQWLKVHNPQYRFINIDYDYCDELGSVTKPPGGLTVQHVPSDWEATETNVVGAALRATTPDPPTEEENDDDDDAHPP